MGPVRAALTFRHTVQRIHATLPARVNELLDPDLKAELTQAANFIRTSTTLFISSYKAHLTDTKEVGAHHVCGGPIAPLTRRGTR